MEEITQWINDLNRLHAFWSQSKVRTMRYIANIFVIFNIISFWIN
jgi:hypothetical protein